MKRRSPRLSGARRDLHDPAFEGEQGLVEMSIESDGALRPWKVSAVLDHRSQRLQPGHDILPRLLNENAVSVLAALLAHRGEIRVVSGQIAVFEVRKLPLVLAEGVVALRVLLEQRERDLLPEPDLAEGIEAQLGFRYQYAVPGGVGQQVANAGARQVQVVPAPLRLEALQLEEQVVEVQEGDVLRLQVGLVGSCRSMALDLRIPVEDHRVPPEMVRSPSKRLDYET